MARRPNTYFNDPLIGAAFGNLAQLFEPPSAQDTASYARAAAVNADTSRKAAGFANLAKFLSPETYAGVQALGAPYLAQFPQFDLYRRSLDTADPAALDSSVYAVKGNYANTVGGQQKALENTLEKERISQSGQTQRQLLSPITANTGQSVFLPPDLAQAIGMPDQVRGPISVNPGQRVVLPNNEVIEGAAKTPTEGEVMGAIINSLPENEQRAWALKGVPREQVIGASGQPEFVFGPDSPGQIPYNRVNAANVRVYRTADGRTGRTADAMTDLQTGEPIPADAQISTITDTSESFGKTEISKARTDLLARRTAIESMIRQVTNLDKMLQNADAPAAIGVIGSAASVINNIAAQAQAGLQLAGVEAPAVLRNTKAYQNTFRELGVQNAELQSALIDLAYSTAQGREPGRLTEADVDRALRTIGGNLQDPIALRRVLHSAVERSLQDYDAAESVLRRAYGNNLNLPAPGFSPLPQETPGAPVQNGTTFIQTNQGGVSIKRLD